MTHITYIDNYIYMLDVYQKIIEKKWMIHQESVNQMTDTWIKN